ncbi:MAG: hypothetical protein JO316_25570 [Abitibacteriaceae bacterium]|nr:hypothetical protein [Abditibacteriaceae bacterium]
MKSLLPPAILTCTGLLFLAVMPVSAQNPLDAAGRDNADTGPDSAASTIMPSPLAPSITAHLQMQTGQIEQLSRLYDGYAARRSEQTARIAQWQNQLRQIQMGTSSEQGQVSRLRHDISQAQQHVTTDLLATRAKAIKTLRPVQQAQLEALATNPRLKVRNDSYYELLLLPVEKLWQFPTQSQLEQDRLSSRPRRQSPSRHNGNANYGVYGGYGYGEPQYGVYGSYGQGSVGVQVGVGRGGPSFGIGVGGILGSHHRR